MSPPCCRHAASGIGGKPRGSALPKHLSGVRNRPHRGASGFRAACHLASLWARGSVTWGEPASRFSLSRQISPRMWFKAKESGRRVDELER